MKLQDGTDSSKLATVNDGKLSVQDADLYTVGVASLTLDANRNTTLTDIKTATEALESNSDTTKQTSFDMEVLLTDILNELKKHTKHFEHINGEEYTEDDIEESEDGHN